mgnify:FL=1
MGVSRSGYYKWLKREKKDNSLRLRAIETVKKVHAEHPSHGYRWICAYLKENNILNISESFTYKITRALGLVAETKHKIKYKRRREKDKYPNLIFSTWESVDRHYQVIVSDMTCFKTFGWNYYELTMYFDVFTKMILAWSLSSRRGDRDQYIDGLEQVKAIIEANGITEPVILHTDQGSVYSSQAYNDIIKNTVIERSMSRAGKPTDNPVNESLNGWIKEELFNDFNLGVTRNVKETIEKYVNYYNNSRPSYAIGYITPSHYLSMFLNGKIKHNDTFSKRKLSEIPKFVQKKMSNKIEEEEVKKELSSWVIKQEIVPSKVEPLSTFIEATSKK